MNENYDTNVNSFLVPTLTKNIKLRLNNPIHAQIDRIVNACKYIDKGGTDVYDALEELSQAGEELSRLAQRKSFVISAEKLIERSEKQSN